MKTASRIIGIISLGMCIVCLLPSIIGLLAGSALMTKDEINSRIIATVLFELFIFCGSLIAITIPAKPFASIISGTLLITAGVLQIIFNAAFSLKFIGSISLLILSWVAIISIIFGISLLIFSIVSIICRSNEKTKAQHTQLSDNDTSKDISNELKKYKSLLDEGLISQEDYENKKKQLLNL